MVHSLEIRNINVPVSVGSWTFLYPLDLYADVFLRHFQAEFFRLVYRNLHCFISYVIPISVLTVNIIVWVDEIKMNLKFFSKNIFMKFYILNPTTQIIWSPEDQKFQYEKKTKQLSVYDKLSLGAKIKRYICNIL